MSAPQPAMAPQQQAQLSAKGLQQPTIDKAVKQNLGFAGILAIVDVITALRPVVAPALDDAISRIIDILYPPS